MQYQKYLPSMKFKHNFFLILLLVIIYSLIIPVYKGNLKILSSEIGIIEILQGLILLICLFLNLKLRSKIKKKLNQFFINIRIFIITFLFYEEISFIFNRLFRFENPNNWQSEFNLHNSKFLLNTLYDNIYIPFTNFKFSIPLDFFFIAISLFVIGVGGCVGGYLPLHPCNHHR